MIAAPAIMAAPFLLGFELGATVLTVAFGVLLLGLALQVEGTSRSVPVAAHAGLDYTLAAAAAIGGLAVAVVSGDWSAGVFLVGIGAAQGVLTAFTRFSVPRNA
jgi:hypothetical protein